MQRILILRGGALGDFIVTLPAIAALRGRWPQARIELVGNREVAQLASRRGLLDGVHSQHESRWAALYCSGPLPSELRDWLADFDLILSYWPDPEGTLQRHLPVRPSQQLLTAAAMPERAPAAAHYSDSLKRLGIASDQCCYRLRPLAEFEHLCVRSGAIAVHPGSGSPTKNWPAERWLDVIAQIEAPVLLVIGEAESETWRPMLARGMRRSVHSAANLPLEELVARLSGCALFLGHDSGISHLAAACGVPCRLLFGPTDPAMWAPPARWVHVIRRGPDLRAITVPEVLQLASAARPDA